MVARGKAARNTVISGPRAMTKPLRKTRSIGQDIAGWNAVHEVQIPGTKIELSRPLLDTLTKDTRYTGMPSSLTVDVISCLKSPNCLFPVCLMASNLSYLR